MGAWVHPARASPALLPSCTNSGGLPSWSLYGMFWSHQQCVCSLTYRDCQHRRLRSLELHLAKVVGTLWTPRFSDVIHAGGPPYGEQAAWGCAVLTPPQWQSRTSYLLSCFMAAWEVVDSGWATGASVGWEACGQRENAGPPWVLSCVPSAPWPVLTTGSCLPHVEWEGGSHFHSTFGGRLWQGQGTLSTSTWPHLLPALRSQSRGRAGLADAPALLPRAPHWNEFRGWVFF